jgi:hypothetical protein
MDLIYILSLRSGNYTGIPFAEHGIYAIENSALVKLYLFMLFSLYVIESGTVNHKKSTCVNFFHYTLTYM